MNNCQQILFLKNIFTNGIDCCAFNKIIPTKYVDNCIPYKESKRENLT